MEGPYPIDLADEIIDELFVIELAVRALQRRFYHTTHADCAHFGRRREYESRVTAPDQQRRPGLEVRPLHEAHS